CGQVFLCVDNGDMCVHVVGEERDLLSIGIGQVGQRHFLWRILVEELSLEAIEREIKKEVRVGYSQVLMSQDGDNKLKLRSNKKKQEIYLLEWVEVDQCRRWYQECSCSPDHLLLLDGEWERGNHDMIHKIVKVCDSIRVRGANMLKESSEKHSIKKCHNITLGHTFHPFGNVVSKIEWFSNGLGSVEFGNVKGGIVMINVDGFRHYDP
ncbi:hypothetical protein Tco_0961849, partial [Tanacetum coccineum]